MQVKTEEKSVNNKKLIPFWVIERALEGDIQAINKILKEKNIPVFFEKENINTMDSKGEVLLTIMASLAQQESQSLS